ncbi:MAG: alpha/beta fold hydrolase [Anaerolineaceae bacterium]|nr:alpha/beta fold hydrolase [Anaerolineaceae bacterium]
MMSSLYVDETGNPAAPSIIFIHGIGVSGWMWKPQLDSLSDFHCLNVDLSGHGKSHQVKWVSMADTAHHIATIIQTRATNGRAHVVGLSLGGHMALELLEHHSNVLDHAVISGVADGPMSNQMWLKPQTMLMSFLLKQKWLMKIQAKSQHLSPVLQSSLLESLDALSTQAYRDIWKEAINFRISPVLQQVNTPTLIVAGSKEPDLMKRSVDKISKLMPNAQGRFASGLGHSWNLEAPDLFSAMIRAWITGAPLPSTLQTTQTVIATS